MEVIREAQVIDNNDPDRKGKVKVRILPDMLNFENDLLPWISIYTQKNGISSEIGEHKVLENNTYIRVLIEDYPYMKRIRFISDDYIEGLYVYNKADGLEITELGSQSYPQPTFQITKDGTIIFHNSDTSEHGTFFKDGSYFLHASNGNFYVNTKGKKLKIYNDQYTLKEIFVDFQEVLLDLVTPLNIIDSRGAPCTFTKAGVDLTKINQALTKLNALLET